MRKPWKPILRTENAFLALLLLSTTLLLVQQGWLWRMDRFLYDIQLEFRERPKPDDIVIVAIDENSLSDLGGWPLPAEYYANFLINIGLDTPKSVAFDFPLPLPGIGATRSDSGLLEALADIPRAILPVVPGDESEMMQAAEMADYLSGNSIAFTGHADVLLDRDGIVRSSALFKGNTFRLWKNINLIAAGDTQTRIKPARKQAGSDKSSYAIFHDVSLDPVLIPFAGPPGHFHTVPFHKVLSGDTTPGEFNNKYILVGVTAANIGRAYPTPNNGFVNPMSRVEINANQLNALVNNMTIQPVSTGWVMTFSGVFALLPFLVFPFFSPRGNVAITIVLLALSLLVSLALVLYSFLWLPPSAALLALVVGYLLWSSRRLANAVHYLERELMQLNTGKEFYDVEMTPDITSIFTHLEKVLSFRGWVVADDENRVIASGGYSPDLSDKQFLADHWSDDGIDHWTSVTFEGKEARIGIRWGEPGDSAMMEKRYLDSLLKSHMSRPRGTDRSAHELVQSLIQQVQDAIINLRETHKFLDDSLSHMADGILVTNDTGTVLLANSRAISYLGESGDTSLAGRDIMALFHTLKLEGNRDIGFLLRESLIGGISVSTHAKNPSGQDLLLQISPSSTDPATAGNIIFNLSDISHLKSVERARNETLSFVSHDLRSPLVSVLALLELAKSRDNSEEITILHSRIESYTKLTISLAEQFIQLARVESDASIKSDVIDLVSIAINAHEQMWVQAQSKKVRMQRNIDIDHGWVRGDSGLLERAISNLLNNAIKYSSEGNTIDMTISRKDAHISVCVEDEGSGIPEDELPLLFERFRRAHSNSGDDQQGIGLGLALVKATAERHGGRIEVHSTVGQGSRFCLVLPETALSV